MSFDLLSVSVVVIDHCERRSSGAVGAKQHGLGSEVRLHGLVKVQMIYRQVREYRCVKLNPEDPPESQRMGRGFHGGVSSVVLLQQVEDLEEFQRFRRGVGCV